MKKLILFAATAAFLFSCSTDDFLGTETLNTAKTADGSIQFSPGSNRLTRADLYGQAAADLLGDNFVVEGTKSTATDAPDYGVVFDHYNVDYTAGSAGSTNSNTDDWEYVGLKTFRLSGLTDTSTGVGADQTIKYWDYSTKQYDFLAYAFGANTEGAAGGSGVTVTATAMDFSNLGNAADAANDPVYSITGTLSDLAGVYISDLVTVPTAQYGNTVQLVFRNLGTKVRIGVYETVPGYSVSDMKFYTSATHSTPVSDTPTLYCEGTDVTIPVASDGVATAKVYVPTPSNDTNAASTDLNKAHVVIEDDATTPTGATSFDNGAFATATYAAAEYKEAANGTTGYIGRQSNQATYAVGAGSAAGYYSYVLPNETGTPLHLFCDYTLTSIDGSGETIKVYGATAIVPAIYTTWKSNYAYTYLFKISDKTNGYTGEYGTDADGNPVPPTTPAGLYPITFDAVVIASTDGVQETITVLGDYSTTTYQKGEIVTVNNEYVAGNIYAMVEDVTSDTPETLTKPDHSMFYNFNVAGNIALFTLSGNNMTEDAIANVLNNGLYTRSGDGNSDVKLTSALSSLTIASAIPAEATPDGNEITTGSNEVAVIAAESGKTYATVYCVSAATLPAYTAVAAGTSFDATETYYIIENAFVAVTGLTAFDANTTYYTLSGTTYTKVDTTSVPVNPTATYYTLEPVTDVASNTHYIKIRATQDNFDTFLAAGVLYTQTRAPKAGEWAIKVIKVQ